MLQHLDVGCRQAVRVHELAGLLGCEGSAVHGLVHELVLLLDVVRVHQVGVLLVDFHDVTVWWIRLDALALEVIHHLLRNFLEHFLC